MRRSTLALTALLFSCFGSAAAPALAELKIDGVAAPGEWSGAVAHPLTGGGMVMLKLSSGFLDLAVRGEGDGCPRLPGRRRSALHPAGAMDTRNQISRPAMVAVWKQARVPAIIARRPSLARSALRSGAMPPMPPIWMAMEEKLAKPHSA